MSSAARRRRKKPDIDIERAKVAPADEFKHPGEVLGAGTLSGKEKEKILNQWEVDAQALSRAADEGMGGGEPTRLASVQQARRKLGMESRSPTRERRTSGKPAG